MVGEGDGNPLRKKPCGARHGCFLCTVTGDRDRSLDALVAQHRYEYMRGLVQLRDFLMATRFDFSRRTWLGKTIDDRGCMRVHPANYSPAMLEELLRYCLTIDAVELEASRSLGLAMPRFRIVPEDALIAIDALWSLRGVHPAFHALKIYQDVFVFGMRYPVPAVHVFPRIELPEPRYLYVGKEWQRNQLDGLRDPMYEALEAPCRAATRMLGDGREVLDTGDCGRFSVNEEWVYFIIEYELPRLVAMSADLKLRRTAAYHWYLHNGVISISRAQAGKVDEILRKTDLKENLGILDEDTAVLLARSVASVSNPEVPVARPAGDVCGQLHLPY